MGEGSRKACKISAWGRLLALRRELGVVVVLLVRIALHDGGRWE